MTNETVPSSLTGLRYEPIWRAIGWILVGVVVWLSLTPQPPQLPSFLGWDKAQHILAYAVLMYWFWLCYQHHWRWPVFFVALGIGLEILQGMGGLRSFDPYDMLANTIGVGIGLFLLKTPMGQWLSVVDRLLAERLMFGR